MVKKVRRPKSRTINDKKIIEEFKLILELIIKSYIKFMWIDNNITYTF